jgi:O-antigen/teichoic acid export membrane protein
MSSAIKSVKAIFSGYTIVTLVGFIFTPLLVRILNQNDYGIYVTIFAAFGIIELLSKGGSFDSVRKFIAENSDDTKEQSKIVTTSLIVYSFWSLIIMFIWVSLELTGLIPLPYSKYAPLLVISLLSVNILTVVRSFYYGVQKESVSEKLSILQTLMFTFFLSF